ncbi:MAG: hypothetical protein IT184_14490 [Acidobacteria bacterium]|nr:hypothetical protein [Acidobacteriota bacterium]
MMRLAAAAALLLLQVTSAPTPPPPPFPSTATLAERRQQAEARPLFARSDPLAFTLEADFKAIDRDRRPESTTTYPATLTFAGPDGTTVARAIRVRGRGHTRRNVATCDFVPLRLEFTKGQMAGTPFAGQDALKLGTHCRPAAVFDQYVLREYSAYRILNLLTPYSFRARLARATYVDTATGKTVAGRAAMFLEDDDDVAKRMAGRVNERRVFGFDRLDPEHLLLVGLFEYMIGNTDVAFKAQHNVRVVETPADRRYAVPYDFDYSGLVNTRYAVVDRTRIRGITTVRERLYLGPCRPMPALLAALDTFRAKQADVVRIYDAIPGMTDGSRREALDYLAGFYRDIGRAAVVERAFVDGCRSDG